MSESNTNDHNTITINVDKKNSRVLKDGEKLVDVNRFRNFLMNMSKEQLDELANGKVFQIPS